GWETLPEKLLREHRDLTLADVLRIRHLLGQKPFESGKARRQMLQGVPVDRSALPDVPRLVIGGGLDTYVPEPEVERLAEWLDAPYEPFGAHSHYGLVLGEQSYLQVAETLRGVLEANRLQRNPRPWVARTGPPCYPRAPSRLARAPVPHSSRGLGHRPLKAEITGSNPVCGTTPPRPPAVPCQFTGTRGLMSGRPVSPTATSKIFQASGWIP